MYIIYNSITKNTYLLKKTRRLASRWAIPKVRKEPVAVWKQALFRLQCNVVMKYVHGKKRRMVRDNRTCTLELYN